MKIIKSYKARRSPQNSKDIWYGLADNGYICVALAEINKEPDDNKWWLKLPAEDIYEMIKEFGSIIPYL